MFEQKNLTIKLCLFPLQIRSFVNSTFNEQVRKKLKSGINGKDYSNKQLYFNFACLIMPKQMMRFIEMEETKITNTFNIHRRRGCSINSQIESLADLDNQSIKSEDEDHENELQHGQQQDDYEKNKISDFINNDFMGLYKGKTLDEKKLCILEIYRYFFRFSIERLKNFIDDPIFIVITLQYLHETQMSRVLQRKTLRKNASAYYRAIENIINLSQYKNELFCLLPTFIGGDMFEIIIDDAGQHALCLQKLEKHNSLNQP